MIDRRGLLQSLAMASAGLYLPGKSLGGERPAGNPFTLGVASGSPTHDSVVLWTRLALHKDDALRLRAAPVPVRWEVAHDEGFTRIVQSGQAQAVAELAHSVHVEVQGLQPDRWYFYRFASGDAERHRPHPHPPGARRRGGPAAAGLCLMPALGARLLQCLPAHAGREPGLRDVPGRLHL
jgi:phosphodiesterase/alkaline phosphatase D-like protein